MDEVPIEQPGLMASLRALAADEAANGASAAVQMRLLDEVRQLRRARRRSLVTMSILTAGLSVATALPIWYLATHHPPGPSSSAPHGVRVPPEGEMVTPFFPLDYSTVPLSGGRLVRLEVPREAVTAFGLEASEAAVGSPSASVLAEVIVGDDGLARAVRFVRPVRPAMKRERQP
jgi:hypothetical protein